MSLLASGHLSTVCNEGGWLRTHGPARVTGHHRSYVPGLLISLGYIIWAGHVLYGLYRFIIHKPNRPITNHTIATFSRIWHFDISSLAPRVSIDSPIPLVKTRVRNCTGLHLERFTVLTPRITIGTPGKQSYVGPVGSSLILRIDGGTATLPLMCPGSNPARRQVR